MLKFGLIVFVLALGFAILTSGGDSTTTSSLSSSYSQCLNDPNTQFQVGVYKQKYPNLSNSSIAHTICK